MRGRSVRGWGGAGGGRPLAGGRLFLGPVRWGGLPGRRRSGLPGWAAPGCRVRLVRGSGSGRGPARRVVHRRLPSCCPSAGAGGCPGSAVAVIVSWPPVLCTGARSTRGPSVRGSIDGRLSEWAIRTRYQETGAGALTIPSLRWEEPPEGPVLVLLDQSAAAGGGGRGWSARTFPALVAGDPDAGRARGAAARRDRGCVWRSRWPRHAASTWRRRWRRLAQARPTAVNLGFGVRRAAAAYRPAFAEGGARQARPRRWPRRGPCTPRTSRASTRMARARAGAAGRAAARAAGHRILTHCNTGALVSGGEGTALAGGAGGTPVRRAARGCRCG